MSTLNKIVHFLDLDHFISLYISPHFSLNKCKQICPDVYRLILHPDLPSIWTEYPVKITKML